MGDVIRFIPRYVNGMKVDQRDTDGFINGTAMCKAHGKDISDWLALNSTLELVAALASRLKIKPNPGISPNSLKTRVSALYPTLVVVKRGSPESGGGTWIHPKLAVHLAQWCSADFALQVSDWIEDWLLTGKNPVYSDVDLDQEYAAWQERYDIRIELKDILRPELMEATRAYAVANNLSPITLCSKVHDTMNERIQGAKAKDIRTFNGLPLSELLRDYFDTRPLHIYAAINRIAMNGIIDSKIEPIEAVHRACDLYLGARYVPKLVKKAENLYTQGQKIMKAKKAKQPLSNYTQLNLFSNDKAV